MESTDWSGIALNHPARCEHRAPCEKFVAFEWTDSGRRFLGCAKTVIFLPVQLVLKVLKWFCENVNSLLIESACYM